MPVSFSDSLMRFFVCWVAITCRTARVVVNEIGNVPHFGVHSYPAIGFGVVLVEVSQGDRVLAALSSRIHNVQLIVWKTLISGRRVHCLVGKVKRSESRLVGGRGRITSVLKST